MIEQFFVNPNKPKPAVTTYTATPYVGYKAEANGFAASYNDFQAQRKKITREEFVRRDVLVQNEAKRCILMHGDIVSYNGKDAARAAEEEGKQYRVMKLYRTYSDFDPDPDWKDEDSRWVVAVRELVSGDVSLASATYYKKVVV